MPLVQSMSTRCFLERASSPKRTRMDCDPNPRPSLKYQNPPERHEKPRRSAKRVSTRDPTIGSPALETRTLWVQGLDNETSQKLSMIRLRKLSDCHQVLHLSETGKIPFNQSMAQVPSSVASRGWIPTIFEHRYEYVWAVEGHVEPEDIPRSPRSDLYTHHNQSNPSETFLMEFRRFACLCGHPNVCWPDCDTNIVDEQQYLREVILSWDFIF